MICPVVEVGLALGSAVFSVVEVRLAVGWVIDRPWRSRWAWAQ